MNNIEHLPGEIWKDAVGYEGYFVSSLGRLASNRSGKLVMLNPGKGNQGYPVVMIRYNGTGKLTKVHRIVAQTFIPNPENKPQVNHKDLNKSNNRVENLEWCTGFENYIHAVRNGRSSPPRPQKRIRFPIPRGKMIYRYGLDGRFIGSTKTIRNEAVKNGVSPSCFANRMETGEPVGNYRYSYERLDKLPELPNKPYKLPFDFTIKRHKGMKPVFALNTSGSVVAYYQSVSIASERTGIRQKSISNVLSGWKNSTHGYVFKYAPYL